MLVEVEDWLTEVEDEDEDVEVGVADEEVFEDALLVVPDEVAGVAVEAEEEEPEEVVKGEEDEELD